MEREFVYIVEGFNPPQEQGRMGGYGFSVYLKRDFALKARQQEVSQEIQDRFQELGKDIVIRRLFSNEYIKPPYSFVENSLLVQSLHVPGDACDLGADWMQIDSLKKERNLSNFIAYHEHNVDNVRQAYALFSLFSKWTEYCQALMENKT